MTLEYFTLGIFLLMMPTLGLVFSKANKNLSDFVRGGGQATWWLVGASILMSSTSAFTFTGNASAAFLAGPTVLIIYGANVVALLVCGMFLAAWMRQTRGFTVADVIKSRFGTLVEQFFAYSQVVLGPLGAAVQLWALAVFASSVFGFPLLGAIIVIGVVIIFYSTTGGKWAVMAADFVQSLVLFSITTLVAVLAIVKIGGFGQFFGFFSDPAFAHDFQFVKEPHQFDADRFSLKWIILIFIMTIYNQLSLSSVDRFLVVKDGREARRSAYLAALLMGVGTIIWFIPPMVARFLYGDAILAQDVDNPANTSYAFIARELLPNGLMGVMIAAMFSATMSAIDTGLNKQVGIIARNVVPWFREAFGHDEPMPPTKEVLLCKALTVLIGGLIILFSVLFTLNKELILFDAYFIVNATIGIPIFFPLIVGLWLRRIPRWAYFSIFGFCMIPSLYALYQSTILDVEWTVQDRMLWIFIFGIVGTLVSMPFYRFSSTEYRERVARFFETMHTPVDFDKEIGVSRTHWQLILLGRSALGLGLAFLLFLLVPNPLWGRVSVLFVAAFSIAVGALLLWGARVERRKGGVNLPRADAIRDAGETSE